MLLPLSPEGEHDAPPVTYPSLAGVSTVQLDAETDGTQWFKGARPIGWALNEPRYGPQYFAFGHLSGNNTDRETFRQWARRELRGKRIENHSTKFDVIQMRADGVDLIEQGCTFHDVAHSAALLDDHRTDFSLDALGRDYLNLRKVDIGPKDDLANLPGGMVSGYACQDVLLVKQLVDHFAPLLAAEGLERVQALEDSVIVPVVKMEMRGMRFDVERCSQWSRYLDTIEQHLQWKLVKLVGFAPNVDSFKDMEKLFLKVGAPIKRTAKGTPSFLGPWMEENAKKYEAIRYAMWIGVLKDLRSKFVRKYMNEHVNGVLYPNLWQLMTDEGGTVSGRFSCSRPNMQQVLAKDKHGRKYAWLKQVAAELGIDSSFFIKDLFVAPEGRQWIGADAKQIEYRLFAHYAGGKLAQRYNLAPSTEVIAGKEYFVTGPEADYHAIISKLFLTVRPDITRTEVKVCNFLCVPPSMPVLTNDLRWVQAGDALVGQKLLSFDEHQGTGRGREKARRWREAEVTDTTRLLRPCVLITLDNGDQLTCSEEHRWLVLNKNTHEQTHHGWKEAKDLKTNDYLTDVIDAYFSADSSYDAGWLAGFMDGEGHSKTGTVLFSQNAGSLFDKACGIADRYGDWTALVAHGKCLSYRMKGNVSDRLKFLGTVRPERLIRDYVAHLQGTMFQARAHRRVVSVESIGEREVVALGTTTKTFIAAGYASHNSIFGGGINALQRNLHCSAEDARVLNDQYAQAVPDAKRLIKSAMDRAEKRGYVHTLFGRRCRFPLVRGEDGNVSRERTYKALNGIIQGGAADILKQTLVEVDRCEKDLDYEMIMTVHDSLEGYGTERTYAPLMELLNEQRVKLSVPILFDGKRGASWGQTE